jgi:hypothetical protein
MRGVRSSWPTEPRVFYGQIYNLLDQVTPLREDCGNLCGKLCCQPANPDTGIYLYPGEEAMFQRDETWLSWSVQQAEEYDFPPSWRGPVYFVRCTGECPRERRPLQCRFFPLTAHFLASGALALIWETIALPYRCPLLGRRLPLEQEFVNAAAAAWSLLMQHPLIRDLVLWDSQERRRSAHKVSFLGPARELKWVPPWQIVKMLRFG